MHLYLRAISLSLALGLGGAAAADPSNDRSFQRDVVAASRAEPVVAYFQAEWCAKCQALLPQMRRAAAAGGVRLVVVDADAAPKTARKLRISALPAVVGFAGGGQNGQLTASDLDEVRLTAFVNQVATGAR